MKSLVAARALIFLLLAGAPSIAAATPLSLPGIPDFRLLSAGAVDTVFPAATGGAAPYTYSLSGQPPGITFFPGTRVATGTLPTVWIETTYTITYGVSDSAGATASVTFLATVVPPSSPPPLALPDIPDFRLPSAGVVNTLFPEATGGSGWYFYRLTGLPPGITFSSGTRVASGTLPTVETETTYTITYSVTDSAGASASVTFLATVVPPSSEPPPPPTSTPGRTLPFTVTETGVAGSREYRFTLASSTMVNLTLTGMDRDFDCRVNSLSCTNRSGTRDDSWTGTLDAGTHIVTIYPYGGGSGSYKLSVWAETGPVTSEPRHFKLSLPWESDVDVHLTDMTIDFDCKVNDSRCTNYGGTRNDSWAGTLPAGNHVIVVYPYRTGSGRYTLSVRVSPTARSSYYGTVTEVETLVEVSEKNILSSQSYPFSLAEGTEVSVELTGLTIDFDCKVDGMRCTNLTGTRDDSWTGWLAAGEHSVEVYPWDPGPGNYSLTVTNNSTVTYVATPFGAGPRATICEQDEHGRTVESACTTIRIDRNIVVMGEDPAPVLLDVDEPAAASSQCHSFALDVDQRVEFELADGAEVAGLEQTYFWTREFAAGTHTVCVNRRTMAGGFAAADRYAMRLTGLGDWLGPRQPGAVRSAVSDGGNIGTMDCVAGEDGEADPDLGCQGPPPEIFDATTVTGEHVTWVFLPWPLDFWTFYIDEHGLDDTPGSDWWNRYHGDPEYDTDGDGVMDDLIDAADSTDCRSRNLAKGERFGAPRPNGRKHGGIDLNTGGKASLFLSPAAGTLSYGDQWKLDDEGKPIVGEHTGCGHYARITTENGYWTICHLDPDWDNLPGAVLPGSYIGFWGGTGTFSGAHLHVDFRNKNWQTVDPLSFVGDEDAIATQGWTFDDEDPKSCPETGAE